VTSTALGEARPAALVAVDLSRLLEAFLAGRKERTIAAYRADLEDFRAFVGVATMGEASSRLLSGSHGEANAAAIAYKAQMTARRLQAATINRRFAALRSLVKLANTLGLVSWALAVENVKAQAYRDTRGPGLDAYKALLAVAQAQPGTKGLRDVALLRLLRDLGLRRGEAVRLDVSDLDLAGDRIMVLGKARSQKEPVTLPEPTKAALEAWLQARGTEDGPLFVNFDRAGKGERLTGSAVYFIVRELGTKAGLTVRPHGLRHLAITSALDLTNGDLRAVQKFSRHKDVRVLNIYDDNRQDLAGDVARLVAGA
jgi:integrase/recombinase XerC